ncbi:MAG: hypothetical protein FJ387_26210 [Verrucomicrobia bacterium]|nr:hypothetical protein [Verrucomicrobiota bacterium]
MKAFLHSSLVWLPLAATLAQMPPLDLDPILVGQSNPYPPRGDMFMLAVENGLAVGALSSGWLAVIDVRDPAQPRWRSAIPGRVSGLALSRGYLLAIGSFQGPDAPTDQWELAAFDLGNPDRPTQVARVGLQDYCRLKVAGSLGFLNYARHVEILDLSDVTHPKPVGRYDVTGGVADVAADGGFACIIEYRDPPFPPELELHVLDLADPSQPRRLGGVHGHGNWYSKVLVRGRQVFLTDSRLDPATTYHAITILDLTDPAQPARIAELDTDGGAGHLALSGNQLYVANHCAIYSVDITDPSRPVVTRRLEFENCNYSGGVTVSGDTVYLGRGPALHLYDGSDPANLRRLGRLATGGQAYDLAVVGRYALVAEGVSGLQIIDVADPNSTRRVGEAVTSGDAVAMEVEGDLACVLGQHLSGGDDQGRITLDLFDVSRLPAVTRLGSYQTDRLASGWSVPPSLALSGQRAYLAGHDERPGQGAWLEIVDVRNPAAPSRLGLYRAGDWTPTALAVRGEYVVVASESGPTEILDVSTPSSPRLVSRLGGFTSVALADTRLYATGEWETQVIDLSNPAEPQLRGTWPIGGRRVLAAGTRAFVLGDNFVALDVIDPSAPRLLGSANMAKGNDLLKGAALDRERVLVIESRFFGAPGPIFTTAMKVFDFSRWANPQRAGSLATHGSATGVAILDTLACVTTSWWSGSLDGGLELLDVSDPANPRRVGGHDIGTSTYGVDAVGRRAYVAAGAAGLQVIDVSDPAAPKRLGGSESGDARGVAVSGHHAFVADYDGLRVLEVSDPASLRRVGA